MRRVEASTVIEAPPHEVWTTITDLDRYPEWNRFTPRISLSTAALAVGAELDLDCRMSEALLLRDEHEVILALDRERLAFCMGTSRTRGRPGIRSQRWQRCEPLGRGRTRFVNREELTGPLAPLVHALYGTRLRRAFAGYCADLKRRVEGGAGELPAGFLRREQVVRLVRRTLGCTCPEAVFDDVRVGCPSLLTGVAVAGSVELLVGGRLLVTVVPTSALSEPVPQTADLLRRGQQARDAHGLNRYRLALVGPLPEPVRRALEGLPLEPRVHLHLLPAL